MAKESKQHITLFYWQPAIIKKLSVIYNSNSIQNDKKILDNIFCSKSDTDRNKIGQGFKSPVHITKDNTPQKVLQFQGSKNMTFDQITSLTENSNDGSPQHEDSIQSPITNQDKEMNDNLDKMQCS